MIFSGFMKNVLFTLNTLGIILFFPLLIVTALELQMHIDLSNETLAGELRRFWLFLFIPQISVTLALLFNAVFSAWQSLYTKSITASQYLKTSYSFAALTLWTLALYLFTLNIV